MNRFIFLLLLASLSWITTLPQDSLSIQQLSKEIGYIRNENKILNAKVDTLNQANDKILNTVYWTIGAILTSVIGLSIWNTIKSQKLNEEKLKEYIEEAKNQLSKNVNEEIENEIDRKVSSRTSSLKIEISSLLSNITNLREDFLITQIKHHPFFSLSSDSHTNLFELIRLVTFSKKTSSYERTLETIKNYIKDDGYLHSTEISELYRFLDEDFNSPNYKYQVEEVKELLKKVK